MALVKLDDLPLQQQGISNATNRSSVSLYLEQQDQYDVEFTGKAQDLLRECSGGWHPSFKHGQAAVKSIASCLMEVADERYTNLKTVYLRVREDSHDLPQSIHPNQFGMLREEVDMCRTLCTETLISLTADMESVSSQSGTLWSERGPFVRALNHCRTSTKASSEALCHLKSADEKHANILSILDLIAQRWRNFHDRVSQLNKILSKQLGMIDDSRGNIQKRLATNKAKLKPLSKQLIRLRSDVQEKERTLESIKKRGTDAKDERDSNEAELNKLIETKESKETDLEQLEHNLKAMPEEFKEAKKRETLRREEIQRKGLGEWLWDALWHPLEELTCVKTWDVFAREHKESMAKLNGARPKLQQDIRDLQHHIERCQQRGKQLSGDMMNRLTQDCDAQGAEVYTELLSQKRKLEALDEEVEVLQTMISDDKGLLFSLTEFGEIVPNLCRHIREAETNIELSYRAHKYIHQKLDGYSTTLSHLSRQMQKSKLSKEETKELSEDAILMRVVFLVISDMSRSSATASRDLYHEDLRVIAPLGIASGPSKSVAQYGGSKKAQNDVNKLSEIGNKIAISVDQNQKESFNKLYPKVEEIIKSTPTKMFGITTKSRGLRSILGK